MLNFFYISFLFSFFFFFIQRKNNNFELYPTSLQELSAQALYL